ncbi:60S ribosomal protein L6 [Dirofilaria immitis]|nr:60S ribosomal protein L6 [Dirofilaria immitis]
MFSFVEDTCKEMSAIKRTPRMRHNYEVAPGIMRFSAARMYAKRGAYARKPYSIVKKKGNAKQTLRPSITPGTILIMLAGRHKGKANEAEFYSATTHSPGFRNCNEDKIDVSGIKIPEHIDDAYFRDSIQKTPKKAMPIYLHKGKLENIVDHIPWRYIESGQKCNHFSIIYLSVKEYTVSDQRKVDQKAIDSMVLEVIRKHPEKKYLFGYLGSRFSLGKNQFPHQMLF